MVVERIVIRHETSEATCLLQDVIPAKAGTHWSAARAFEPWVPAFAGMRSKKGLALRRSRNDLV
jgi:hypothetical protein